MFKKAALIFLPLISIVLLVLSFTYLVITKSAQSSTIVYYKLSNEQNNNITTITQKEKWTQADSSSAILAKKKIYGNFTAQTDNLGIVTIPFNTHNRSIDDRVVFRIKQADNDDWYYQGIYNTNQIQTNIAFPFGFPTIKNSKNISYIFEIESLHGTSTDFLSLSETNPYFLIKYKFTKSDLTKNPFVLSQFIIAKTVEQIPLLKFREIMLIFMFSAFFPLILYLVLKNMKKVNKALSIVFIKAAKSCMFILISNKNRILKKKSFVEFLMDDIKLFVEKFKDFIYKNDILVLVVILLITLLTRFVITYTYKENRIIDPEIIFSQPTIGADFLNGTINVIDLMIHGKSIYTHMQIYGSGFTLLTTPIIYLLNFFNICDVKYIFSCHLFLYRWVVFFSIAGFLVYIFIISYKKKELVTFFLLYFIVFLLTIYGSFGLERGNTDIILSLLFGYLLLLIMLESDKKKHKILIIQAIAIGIISAFLVNSKVFLLPVGLVAIYSSRKMLAAFLSFIITFCLLGYLPDILFNSPSNPLSTFFSSLEMNDPGFFPLTFILQYNYTFNAIASLATNCVQRQNCQGALDVLIISSISVLLFIFTFVIPFLAIRPFKNILMYFYKQPNFDFLSRKNFKIAVQWLNKQRLNKNFIILLFILSVAASVLLPRITILYRLYYTLPLLMLLWKETEKNKKARIYCLLSIICLGIKGLWILNDVYPPGFNIFEARGMVIFVVLGFYFMIKSGIELFVSKNTRLNADQNSY